ncbi:MAG: hypothetical protein HYY43_00630 [Deltaproteobacteria bacterium]|nr:hypothetical protein [Deltaproteobacteria bacterium]MBI2974093.1 hypothetical protein [Deltaproteobacteria bacterium]
MKKSVLVALVAVVASWVLLPTLGLTTAEIGKKEGKPCTFCHVKPMKGDENLNDVGKCYKEKKDVKACEKK